MPIFLEPEKKAIVQNLVNSEYLNSLVKWVHMNDQSSNLYGTHNLKQNENFSYILECLGPILFNTKPAELLNIGLNNNVKWEEFKELLKMRPAIGLIEIRKVNKLQQTLFYNRYVLGKRLSTPMNQDFMKKMNYPWPFSWETCLEQLVKKIQHLDFPHEIGLFLGYPLEDVLGFMGLAPFPYIKTQGWRVYGNEQLSDLWFKKYQAARQLMRERINVG